MMNRSDVLTNAIKLESKRSMRNFWLMKAMKPHKAPKIQRQTGKHRYRPPAKLYSKKIGQAVRVFRDMKPKRAYVGPATMLAWADRALG